jgi:predicted ATP-grasp superfamily ATP-dependent carboligase
MADHVTFLHRPALTRPVFICAFSGWNDGGEAASIAARYLIERWDGKVFAHLDPEEFFDFQVSRPTVRLEDGVSRTIEWPRGEFARASAGGRDVVVFTSPEPNVRWRTFAAAVLHTAREVGSELVVTLGAFLTDVPHTRPVPVVGSAFDERTVAELGLTRSQYEGPTGITGVLHDASNRLGMRSVSLWAAVPHYLPSAPNPKAALALVERTTRLLGLEVDTAELARAASGWEEGVLSLVRESEELSAYVERLEAAAEESLPEEQGTLGGEAMPSGEVLAEELERFLREQEGEG